MNLITRAYDAKLDVSEGERSVVAVVNTAAVDRYHTVISPEGIDLAAYRRNPVVLWEHGRGNDGKPIGRNAWIKFDKASKALVAKTIFLDDAFSDGVFRLYQSSALRAFSVNILPEPGKCDRPTSAEIKARPELAECQVVYRKSELAEYSAVSVPGNAEALALAVSRGLWVPEGLRNIPESPRSIPDPAPIIPESPLPPLVGRTFGQVYAEAIRTRRDARARQVRNAIRDAMDLMQGRV